MPTDKAKGRKRMVVVEEVGAESSEPEVNESAVVEAPVAVESAATEEALGEVIEKVEELKDITETIAEEVDKSVEVQEELSEAAEKVAPAVITANDNAEMGPPQPIGQSRMPSMLLVLIPGVLILGAILGGIYFYQKSISGGTAEETPMPTVEASQTPSASATPSATLDLSKYPINVQNGVGTAGIAGTAKDTLTAAGFKVSATGNADNYDYTETVIKVKSTVPSDFVTKLTSALSGKYKVAAKTETLSASSKDDVVVIIGSSKP